MSDDTVERLPVQRYRFRNKRADCGHNSVTLETAEDGNWVSHDDYEQQARTIAELLEQLQTAQYNADCAEFAAKREGNTRLAEQAARLAEARGHVLRLSKYETDRYGYYNPSEATRGFLAAIDGAKT